jgi:hypothetical protein
VQELSQRVAEELRSKESSDLSPRLRNTIKDLLHEMARDLEFKVSHPLQSKLTAVEHLLEDAKKDFLENISRAEDEAFRMNEEIVGSIVSKLKWVEKEVLVLANESRVKKNSPPRPEKGLVLTAEFELLTKNLDDKASHKSLELLREEMAKETIEECSKMNREIKQLAGNFEAFRENIQNTVEQKLIKIDEKLLFIDKLKLTSGKEKQSALSYFLSPEEINSNRSNHGCQDKKNLFEKKKVPNINLNSIIHKPEQTDKIEPSKEKEENSSKPLKDDLYTSFEEEFRFRLGKAKIDCDEKGAKIDDMKLSYMFSSNSKDNHDNIESGRGFLSRRLFDEAQKGVSEFDMSIKPNINMTELEIREFKENIPFKANSMAAHTGRNETLDDYSALLNNLSVISKESVQGKKSAAQKGSEDRKDQNEANKSLFRNAVKKEEVKPPNLLKESQQPRPIIKTVEEEFDFDKWAKENQLNLGGLNL